MMKLMFIVTAGVFVGAFGSELVKHKRARPHSRLRDVAREFRQGFMEGLRGETVRVAP